jgi:hypothetical protein
VALKLYQNLEHMNIIPLPYAIPDEYIVTDVPAKTRIFSEVQPGNRSNYCYGPGEEEAYHEQYRTSRFAYTERKGGWDCLRHYEILAAGCIPVFKDLEACPDNTMVSFPKALVLEACSQLLPWTGKEALYDLYVRKLLAHCRDHCSVSAITRRFLEPFPTANKILMIRCHEGENYTRELLALGLRRRFGSAFVDYPKIGVLYKGCDLSKRHGNGFTYGGKLEEPGAGRYDIDARIRAREFDLIIYGKVGRDEIEGTLPMAFWSTVSESYDRSQIAFLYGGDGCQTLQDIGNPYTQHLLRHATKAVCFVRELL